MLRQLLPYFLCFYMEFNSFVRGLNSYSKIVVARKDEIPVSAATIGCWCVNSHCLWMDPSTYI